MKNLIAFVAYYNVFMVAERDRKVIFNKRAFFSSIQLFLIMYIVLIGFAFLFNLETNLLYLFMTVNSAFLGSFLLYYYMNLEDSEEHKIHRMIYKTLLILYYQLGVYIFLMYTILSREPRTINIVISVFVFVVLSIFFLVKRVRNFRLWDYQNIIISGIIQTIASSLTFMMLVKFIGIKNITLGFLVSYTLMYILSILYSLMIRYMNSEYIDRLIYVSGLTLLVIISIGVISVVIPEEDEANFYNLIYTDVYRGELYVPIVNFTRTIELNYPVDIQDYALEYAFTMILEEEDYIYLYMTSEEQYYSTTTYYENDDSETDVDIVHPFTYIIVFDKEFNVVTDYYYDSFSLFMFFEDRLMFLLDTGVDVNDSKYRPICDIYEIIGTEVVSSTINNSSTMTGYTIVDGYLMFEDNDMLYRTVLTHYTGEFIYEYNPDKDYDDLIKYTDGDILFGDNYAQLLVSERGLTLLLKHQLFSLMDSRYTALYHNDVVYNNGSLYTMEEYTQYESIYDVEEGQLLDIGDDLNHGGFKGIFATDEYVYLNNHNQIFKFDYNGNRISYVEVFVNHFDMSDYEFMALDNYMAMIFYNDAQIRLVDMDDYSHFEFDNTYVDFTLFDFSLLICMIALGKRSLLL